MKTFVIQEKFVGYADITIEAETKEEVLEISQRWAPYRTAASWYLWRMLDPVPVEY